MSNSNDMSQMYQENVKAQQPDYKGTQYADSPAAAFGGSTESNHLQVTYDSFGNEIAADRPFHENTTPEQGGWAFGENHYADGPWKSGYGASYATGVSDMGKNPQVERTSVDTSRADRGKEA